MLMRLVVGSPRKRVVDYHHLRLYIQNNNRMAFGISSKIEAVAAFWGG